jgi:hypothetical protein
MNQHSILTLLRLLKVKRPLTKKLIRLGNKFDGGYVICDDLKDIQSAVSIGIGWDVSFDYELAELGIKVYQFDHTVQTPPVHHDNFVFSKLAWAETKNETEIGLEKIQSGFGIKGDSVLKFDVEGAEWANLSSVSTDVLKQYRIIVCEFHSMHRAKDKDHYLTIIDTISKLLMNHTLIHMHANNYSSVNNVEGISMPDVIELSFLRNDRDLFVEYDGPLPCSLDYPNCPSSPDIILKW